MYQLKLPRVLHVPALRSNLLSVLFLVKRRAFAVRAQDSTVTFHLQQQRLFTATINEQCAAHLDASTQLHSAHELAARAASTLP